MIGKMRIKSLEQEGDSTMYKNELWETFCEVYQYYCNKPSKIVH